MPSKIEDYALLGDCETSALVARDGSVNWLCWPRFDSGACFAALLGGPDNGRWIIAPCEASGRRTRRYRGNTLILETDIETVEGAVTLVEFMPPRGIASGLVRLVLGKSGKVTMRTELIIRFDYGSLVPWVTRRDDRTLCAVSGPDMVVLRTPVPLRGEDRKTVGEFTVSAGETVAFVLTYGASHLELPARIDPMEALANTEAFWRDWSSQFQGAGEWSEPVLRSLITLKALTERHLMVDGFVLRYDPSAGSDGLPGGEGAFLACSFWLADNLVLLGRRDDARRLFQRLLALRNDVGLLSEEYDPRAKRLVGNFPQAFSHITLVNTAHNLSRMRKPAEQRSGHSAH